MSDPNNVNLRREMDLHEAPKPSRHRFLALAVIVLSLLVIFWVVTPGLFPSGTAEDIIEQLASPVQVVGWNAEGIVLEDKRTIRLPDCRRMPVESQALPHLTKQGVEITSEGRVIGLVRIWNWCGTCARGEHIVRVDIADALYFFSEGEWDAPASRYAREMIETSARIEQPFSKWGWNISSYGMFVSVHSSLTQARLEK